MKLLGGWKIFKKMCHGKSGVNHIRKIPINFQPWPTEQFPKPEYLIARLQLTERGPVGIRSHSKFWWKDQAPSFHQKKISQVELGETAKPDRPPHSWWFFGWVFLLLPISIWPNYASVKRKLDNPVCTAHFVIGDSWMNGVDDHRSNLYTYIYLSCIYTIHILMIRVMTVQLLTLCNLSIQQVVRSQKTQKNDDVRRWMVPPLTSL